MQDSPKGVMYENIARFESLVSIIKLLSNYRILLELTVG